MKEQDRDEQKPEMKAQVSLTSNDEHAIQLELLSALQKGGGHRIWCAIIWNTRPCGVIE